MACLCILPSVSKSQALSPDQQYTTGNIVTDTPYGGPSSWVNGVYQNNLTCWGWGNPGYCGPDAIVRPGNNINFSFGFTNLYQIQSVANALPNTGTGLRVDGYNFGFTAKNGNGWDDGRVDYLNAYVSFYDTKGNTTFNKNYDLNYKFNWTTFNYSENFTTPIAAKDLGSVQYGFVGRDNNGWAGPYGPEVNNITFSLKYSVDPCSVNVLSSPSCPGYLQEISKVTTTAENISSGVATSPPIISETSPVSSTVVAPVTVVNTTPASTNSAPVITATKTVDSSQPSKVSGPSLSTILNIVKSEQSRVAAVEKTVVQQAVKEAASSSQAAQDKAELVAASLTQQSISSSYESTSAKTTSSSQATSQVSNSVASSAPITFNQNTFQTNNILIAPTPQVSNQTTTQFNNTAATPVTAVSSPATTQTSNTAIIQETAPVISILPHPTNTIIESTPIMSSVETNTQMVPRIIVDTSQQTFTITGTESLIQNRPDTNFETNTTPVPDIEINLTPPPAMAVYTPTQSNQSQQMYSIVPTQPLQVIKTIEKSPEPEIISSQTEVRFGERNLIIDQTSKQEIRTPDVSVQSNTPAVNKGAMDNDAAGSVTIASIAKQPPGFELYLSSIKDTVFYAPKEIYKNQNVVDNQRAMRLMGGRSDRLHEQMVSEQYKK